MTGALETDERDHDVDTASATDITASDDTMSSTPPRSPEPATTPPNPHPRQHASSTLHRAHSLRTPEHEQQRYAKPEADSHGSLRMRGEKGSARLRRHHSERQRLAYEDCCAYCDVHCQERLTPWRKGAIQAWSEGVRNSNDKQNNRLQCITQRNSWRAQEQAKKRYMQNYVPPGEPDLEDGFRRIVAPFPLRSQQSSTTIPSKSRERSSKHATGGGEKKMARKSSSTNRKSAASKQRDFLNEHLEFLDMCGRFQNCSEDAFQGSLKSASTRFEPPPNSLVRRPSAGVIRVKDSTPKPDTRAQSARSFVSNTSQPLERDGIRSNSNIILNVYTIDDALRQMGHGTLQDSSLFSPTEALSSVRGEEGEEGGGGSVARVGVGSVSGGGTTPSRTTTPSNTHSRLNSARHHRLTMGSIMEENATEPTIKHSPSPVSSSESQPRKDGHKCCGHSDAVKTAFRTIAKAKTVVYDKQLYRGLMEDKTATDTNQQQHKEQSDNFSRMNKKLRSFMEDYHHHGSGLSRKIDRWYGRCGSGATSPKSQTKSAATNSRPSRQHQGHGHTTGSDVDYESQSKAHYVDASNAEHFLEMLMDIDSNEPVNTETFLYV